MLAWLKLFEKRFAARASSLFPRCSIKMTVSNLVGFESACGHRPPTPNSTFMYFIESHRAIMLAVPHSLFRQIPIAEQKTDRKQSSVSQINTVTTRER